jgi:hypothetical protein
MKSPGHSYDAAALVLLVTFGLIGAVFSSPAKGSANATPIPVMAKPTVEHFPTAAAALEEILRVPARVIAVGEYHQTTATAGIRSSVSRFADEMLPVLSRVATDFVVETWVSTGSCGATETKVTHDVEVTTERPPETENEIVTLLKRAKGAGLSPHVLTMSCKDYRYVTDKSGETDFSKMLKLTSNRIQDEVLHWLNAPPAQVGRANRTIAVYGGALHNDLYPSREDKAYAFGRSLFAKANGEYLEIDLFVPEYIADDRRLAAEPWFGLFREASKAGDALLIRRSARSFVILFPPAGASEKRGNQSVTSPSQRGAE